MSVYYYDPFTDFNRLFDNAFANWSAARSPQTTQSAEDSNNRVTTFRPRVDVHDDTEKNLVTVSVELPGMKKEDIHLDVHNDQLTISGETTQSSERNEDGYVVRERRSGKFSRVLPLPRGVKSEDLKAGLNDGVLTVTYPKVTEEQQAKRIAIN